MSTIPYTSFVDRTTGTKEDLRQFYPLFYGWQSEEDNEHLTIYFGDFKASDYTPIGTGTGEFDETDIPNTVGDKFKNVFDFSNPQRPFAKFARRSYKINVAAPGDGMKLSTGLFSFDDGTSASADNLLGLVMRTTTPMDVSFTLEDSAANTATYTFATGTSFDLFSLELDNPTSSSGTCDLNDIVSISGSGSEIGEIIINKGGSANNYLSFVGSTIKERYNCVGAYTLEHIREMADRMCGNYITGKSITNIGLNFNLTTNEYSLSKRAAVMGETPKKGSSYGQIYLNASAGARASKAITAGTITLDTGLSPEKMYVEVAGNPIAVFSTSATVENGLATYDPATGTLTFSTIWNGKIPTILYMDLIEDTSYYDFRNQKTGFVGKMSFTRVDDVTEQYLFDAVQPMQFSPTQGDAQVSWETQFTAYPVQDGADFRIYRFTHR